MVVTKDNTTAHGSSDYDSQIRRTIPYYDQFHTETINIVLSHNPNPSVWADTGCGTGILIEQALLRFPSTKFFLADPSEAMLSIAAKGLGSNSRVQVLEAVDSKKLVLPVAADVITAIQAHHYMKDIEREASIENCYRLLNSEGIFVTFENIAPATKIGTDIGKSNWMRFQIEQGKTPDEARKHLERFGTEYFPISVEEHLRILKKIGEI